jgi:hypothetical protein
MTASNTQKRNQMENNKDTPVVVCMRTNTPGHTPSTVGIEAHCIKCSEMVWLSDTSIRSVKKLYEDNSNNCDDCRPLVEKDPASRCENHSMNTNPPMVLCVQCAMEHLEKEKESGEDIKLMPYTEEQRDEILKALKQNG